MQNHKLKFHSCCFFKFSNFCKISRAPAISLHSDNKFPSCWQALLLNGKCWCPAKQENPYIPVQRKPVTRGFIFVFIYIELSQIYKRIFKLTINYSNSHLFSSWEICCACARFPLKLEDFPEEITRCSWLLYIFECLFNLYNFFARDKDKVKCTLRFQCIEYLVCV